MAFPGGPFFNDIEHWTRKSGGNLDEEVGVCVHGFEFERPFLDILVAVRKFALSTRSSGLLDIDIHC